MSDLLSHDVLVISQKAKLIETMDEYRVFDDAGTAIGTIREVEQSTTKRAMRLFSGIDQYLTHKLAVCDSDGQQVLMLERPAKLIAPAADHRGDLPRRQRLTPTGPSARWRAP